MQGEDTFLDALPEPHRAAAWQTLAERCADIDLFIPPTQYFGRRMSERLRIPESRVRVIYDGINLEGYQNSENAAAAECVLPRIPRWVTSPACAAKRALIRWSRRSFN